MNKKKNNKGFSLIELIIAIAILIILTGLLAPQFMKYIEKSREAKDVQTMDTVYASVQAALANEGAYDVIIEETEKDSSNNVYYETLENILANKDAFGLELKGLLGEAGFSLKSKKAKGGEICVAIRYNSGEEEIEVPGKDDPDIIDVFAGFSVMIYGGDSGRKLISELQPIGANLTSDVPKG